MCGNSAYCWNTVLTLRLYGGTSRDVLAVEQDPPVGGLLEAGDHPQRRGLAAARRPEHREELARADGEVGVVDGDEVAEALRHVVEADDGVARPTHRWRALVGQSISRSATPELRPQRATP